MTPPSTVFPPPITSEPDLQRTSSPASPRGLLSCWRQCLPGLVICILSVGSLVGGYFVPDEYWGNFFQGMYTIGFPVGFIQLWHAYKAPSGLTEKLAACGHKVTQWIRKLVFRRREDGSVLPISETGAAFNADGAPGDVELTSHSEDNSSNNIPRHEHDGILHNYFGNIGSTRSGAEVTGTSDVNLRRRNTPLFNVDRLGNLTGDEIKDSRHADELKESIAKNSAAIEKDVKYLTRDLSPFRLNSYSSDSMQEFMVHRYYMVLEKQQEQQHSYNMLLAYCFRYCDRELMRDQLARLKDCSRFREQHFLEFKVSLSRSRGNLSSFHRLSSKERSTDRLNRHEFEWHWDEMQRAVKAFVSDSKTAVKIFEEIFDTLKKQSRLPTPHQQTPGSGQVSDGSLELSPACNQTNATH